MTTNSWLELPAIGSPSWKDPVVLTAQLPVNNNILGDVRLAEDTNTIYVWTGSAWLAVATPGAAIAIDGLNGDVSASGPGVVPASIIATSNSTLTTLSALSLPASQLTGKGNLTDVGTDGITVTNGTGAVIGTGTAISQQVADTTHNGYLSSTDWNTFNGKQPAGSYVPTSRTIATTAPITGGGDLSANRTIAIPQSTSLVDGYLSGTDWTTFNNKQAGPLTGGVTTSGTTATVVTNANLTGVVTSTGNATAVANGAITNAMLANGAVANLSGTNTGDITIVAFGSSPTANAASLSGQALTIQPADGTHPGAIAAAAQTMGSGIKTFTSNPVFSAMSTAGVLLNDSSGNITSSASALAIANGGTGVTSVTTAPAATAWAGWDANKNISTNATIPAFTTTVTSATPITLVVGSTENQVLTGSTGQVVNLPTTSVVQGQQYVIINVSSATVTIKASAGATILSVASTQSRITCTARIATPTVAADWAVFWSPLATIPAAMGGTGTTSVTQAPAASAFAGWDGNKNFTSAGYVTNLTSTAQAAGTTTMSISATGIQVWTGSGGQTIKLPTTSVQAGQQYKFINLGSGNLSIQSSGANAIGTVAANAKADAIALVATPTTAANWSLL